MRNKTEKGKHLYSIVFLFSSLVLHIMSVVPSIERKDFVGTSLVFCVLLMCIFHNWLIGECGYQKNILFLPFFYNMKAVILFFIFFIMGGIPIIFQFGLGGIYRFHHIINNIVTIPFTLTALIKYVAKLDRICSAVEISNKLKDKMILRLSPVMLQSVLFYVINFMKSYKHNPPMIMIRSYYITAEAINMIYQVVVFFLFILCLLYIILYFITSKKNDEYSFRELFPKWPITGVALFYVFWGCMAFYETENRIEVAYYLSIILIACVILVLTILLWMKLNTCGGVRLMYYNLVLALSLVGYGTVILYLESIGFSKVQTEEVSIHSSIAMMILVFIAMLITLVLFKSMLEKKYQSDVKRGKKKDS